MPWHSERGTNAFPSGTNEVTGVWALFDKEDARYVSVSQRRAALNNLGARIPTAHLSAEWSKQDASALRRVFDRCDVDQDHAIDVKELPSALDILGIDLKPEEASKWVKLYDANRSGKLELGEVRGTPSRHAHFAHR